MSSNTISRQNSFESFTEALEACSIRFSPRFLGYRPKQTFCIETQKYRLKTVTTKDELIAVFRLRYLSFLEQVESSVGLFDLDEFDHLCDHLVILCKESGKVVGTYRVLCSHYSDKFYSEGEFNLSRFLNTPGTKLELGRACIDPDHRNGHAIDLLWKGIGKYIGLTQASYLFGCSSIKTVEAQMASNIHEYFQERGELSDEFKIQPTTHFQINFEKCSKGSVVDVKSWIPSLLRSYLTAGAKVHGLPALDREFECIDFLTILSIDNLSSAFKRRYFR